METIASDRAGAGQIGAPDAIVEPGGDVESSTPTPSGPRKPTDDDSERAWQQSDERARAIKSRNRTAVYAPVMFIAGVCLIAWSLLDSDITGWMSSVMFIVGCALAGGGLGSAIVIPFVVSSQKKAFIQRRDDIKSSAEIIRDLTAAPDEPTMANLLVLNRQEMKQYHDLTTEQATVSFRHSQRAMIGGFVVVILCIGIATVPAIPTETKLIVGGVGAISTVLSGYITNTFLKAHAASVAQLNRFFTQPLISSYLLTAERVARELDTAARDQALQQVVAQALRSAAGESAVLQADTRALTTGLSKARKSTTPTGLAPNDDGSPIVA